MVTRDELLRYWDQLLDPCRFKDYGPNGLQVEGRHEIRTLVSGVTASRALIEAALQHEADAIVVHHGLFWRNQSPCITGWLLQRLKPLLANGINLFAYHLPLDAHPRVGNNVQLARHLGWTFDPDKVKHFGEQELGWLAEIEPCHVSTLADGLRQGLRRDVTVVDASDRPIRRLAWCTGGAQGYFESAIAAGADAFVTGEISEPQMHLAQECGVSYIACGHHASEQFGAPALGEDASLAFGLRHVFVGLDNPA